MEEVSFERPVRAEPARVLRRLDQWFTAHGYVVSARSSHELHFTGAATGGRHRLTASADGARARFVFAAGAPGVALPETAELERRVDAALQDLWGTPAGAPAGAKAASPSGRRCSICATALSVTDQICPTCGMTQP